MPQVVHDNSMDASPVLISPRDNSIKYVLDLTKRILKNVEFKGTFTEKRFVDLIEAYRDVISVDENEKDFIKSLDYVKERLDRGILFKKWIGITKGSEEGAPPGHNLWVCLPCEIFGSYRFRVRTVEFIGSEIRLKLEILNQADGAASNTPPSTVDSTSNAVDLSQSIRELGSHMHDTFFSNCRQLCSLLTVDNVLETVKFMAILLAAIFTFLVKSTHFLLEYLLKLMRELSNFIRVLTPIFACFMNSFTNITIGLFHYTYRLFRKEPDQVYVTNIPYPMAMQQQQRHLPISGSYQSYPRYITGGGVRIQEIN